MHRAPQLQWSSDGPVHCLLFRASFKDSMNETKADEANWREFHFKLQMHFIALRNFGISAKNRLSRHMQFFIYRKYKVCHDLERKPLLALLHWQMAIASFIDSLKYAQRNGPGLSDNHFNGPPYIIRHCNRTARAYAEVLNPAS